MTHAEAEVAALHREADRCERIGAGLSDPALVRTLRGWADEYRRQAEALLDYRQAA